MEEMVQQEFLELFADETVAGKYLERSRSALLLFFYEKLALMKGILFFSSSLNYAVSIIFTHS